MIAHTVSSLRAERRLSALALALLTMLALWLAPAKADEGHDHGDAPAVAPAAQALPRFSASSEDFELVGVLAGSQLTLYLDRSATNEPVREASIELDIGGRVVQAKATHEGTFVVTLPQALPEGSTPITATVIAGGTSDLLAADIDIHADGHEDGLPHAHWRRIALWGVGGLAVVSVLALLWHRRSKRASRTEGVA